MNDYRRRQRRCPGYAWSLALSTSLQLPAIWGNSSMKVVNVDNNSRPTTGSHNAYYNCPADCHKYPIQIELSRSITDYAPSPLEARLEPSHLRLSRPSQSVLLPPHSPQDKSPHSPTRDRQHSHQPTHAQLLPRKFPFSHHPPLCHRHLGPRRPTDQSPSCRPRLLVRRNPHPHQQPYYNGLSRRQRPGRCRRRRTRRLHPRKRQPTPAGLRPYRRARGYLWVVGG